MNPIGKDLDRAAGAGGGKNRQPLGERLEKRVGIALEARGQHERLALLKAPAGSLVSPGSTMRSAIRFQRASRSSNGRSGPSP